MIDAEEWGYLFPLLAIDLFVIFSVTMFFELFDYLEYASGRRSAGYVIYIVISSILATLLLTDPGLLFGSMSVIGPWSWLLIALGTIPIILLVRVAIRICLKVWGSDIPAVRPIFLVSLTIMIFLYRDPIMGATIIAGHLVQAAISLAKDHFKLGDLKYLDSKRRDLARAWQEYAGARQRYYSNKNWINNPAPIGLVTDSRLLFGLISATGAGSWLPIALGTISMSLLALATTLVCLKVWVWAQSTHRLHHRQVRETAENILHISETGLKQIQQLMRMDRPATTRRSMMGHLTLTKITGIAIAFALGMLFENVVPHLPSLLTPLLIAASVEGSFELAQALTISVLLLPVIVLALLYTGYRLIGNIAELVRHLRP